MIAKQRAINPKVKVYAYILGFFCCSLLDTSLSGAPIIQNGKFVGAVTHVLVQNSAEGYGIFIEDMVEH